MEFIGSGGIVLLILAVLWLSFIAPANQNTSAKPKNKRKTTKTTLKPAKSSIKVSYTPRTLINTGIQAEPKAEKEAEKVVINRLPDPLSARIGKIENVAWAEVKDLDSAREEKQRISSENLDEILKRRRSIG
ncbi:MAG: hypothetical protein EBR26_00195 [Microbacteriaceae bacterium]|nr:hypothetical protein [Microbacteriaceae bacterium]